MIILISIILITILIFFLYSCCKISSKCNREEEKKYKINKRINQGFLYRLLLL